MFLNYFWLVFYMPIACAQLSRCHHRTQFGNLDPLALYLNSITLYINLNRIITINSDNFPPLYFLLFRFTRTFPSLICFRYLLIMDLFCLPPLKFVLNIISNSNSQKGILNFLPLQCFGNIIIFHQDFLARDFGMVGINCIDECIYIFSALDQYLSSPLSTQEPFPIITSRPFYSLDRNIHPYSFPHPLST